MYESKRIYINRWNTIRNKLASIDHVNKLALTPTSWSDNPQLIPFVSHAKKFNASDPNLTALPFTRDYLISLIDKCNNELLYQSKNSDSNTSYDKSRKSKSLISAAELTSHQHLLVWRQTLLIGTLMGVTGMRIGETLRPIQLHKAAIYGIQIKHIQIFHKLYAGSGKYRIVEDNTSMDATTVFTIRITIQNSKMRNINEEAYAFIGRSKHRIDPAIMLFDWYHSLQLLSQVKSSKWKFQPNAFLFQKLDGNGMTTGYFRLKWKKLIQFCGFLKWERLALPHGLRKGYASQMTRHGVDKGWIAFAARWKLPESIYIYLSLNEFDLMNMTQYYFHAKTTNKYEYDFDEAEYRYFMNNVYNRRKGIDSITLD